MKLENFDFRIWDKEEEALICASRDYRLSLGFYDKKQDNGEVKSILYPYFDGEPLCPDDCEIELWSGFYDKKSAKIYEGDIVYFDLSKSFLEVVWGWNTFYIVSAEHKDLSLNAQIFCGVRLQNIYDFKDYKDNIIECLEVIGNVHFTDLARLQKIRKGKK